jgi:hypothetical protein
MFLKFLFCFLVTEGGQTTGAEDLTHNGLHRQKWTARQSPNSKNTYFYSAQLRLKLGGNQIDTLLTPKTAGLLSPLSLAIQFLYTLSYNNKDV